MFCAKRGNEYFCEIPEDFLVDKFNLTGLGLENPKLAAAYNLVLDDFRTCRISYYCNINYFVVGSVDEQGGIPAELESTAPKVYGLIHARYIQTPQGIAQMHKKYINGVFGCCPRVLCQNQGLLPIGLSDKPGVDSVKLYCMCCEDIYLPKSSAHNNIDGAYFGTSFPQLYILSNKIVLPPYEERVMKFVPKIFGFRLADPEMVAQIEAAEKSRRQQQQ